MKKIKDLSEIIFWLTLFSPMYSFALASEIGEIDIFGVAGIVRYSWVMLLFIPVGVLSILIGLKLKNSNQKYKKNFIIAYICLPLLLIFGSYRLIFTNITYDVEKISIIEEKVNLDLPEEIKVATMESDLYCTSYVKITSSEDKEVFERELASNELWQLWQYEFNSGIISLLPFDVLSESHGFDYFVFYNITNDEYNKITLNEECEIIFIAYDKDLQKLVILDEYKIDLRH